MSDQVDQADQRRGGERLDRRSCLQASVGSDLWSLYVVFRLVARRYTSMPQKMTIAAGCALALASASVIRAAAQPVSMSHPDI
jgi:hypothetical protein